MTKTVASYHFDTLAETISKLNEEDCTIIAGGTDVMVLHKSRRGVAPKIAKPVVFIDHLRELKQTYLEDGDLHIGACCTYGEMLEHSLIPNIFKKAIREVAAPAIRNRGTLGGNICNASPAGDMLPLLYIFNAKLVLRSVNEDRIVEIHDFIQGPRRIARQQNELLVEIILPEVVNEARLIFEKIANRRADAISKVSFAGLLQVQAGKVADARFAFGAVGPTMVRSQETEKKLLSQVYPLKVEVLDEVVADFASIINPIDDQRSTAAYRKTVALKLLRYFLTSKELF
ncbi:FAD binding domain-containing protein [Robertmurraya kyonggiensis]|uniref:FAD binding domain-containing protein n=1 Tax=Robertmurraya kyonggiensis TaxID=1037680 RepID=UPI00130DA240|nr:FAD binding domain-containing protein [Robertmurraya kyonggiensis]